MNVPAARFATEALFRSGGGSYHAKRAMSISALSGFEGKHLISIDKLSNEELRGLLDLSKDIPEAFDSHPRVHGNWHESPGRACPLPRSV